MIDTRGKRILDDLHKIDKLLVAYANANTSQKGRLKQRIKEAYTTLHGKFGSEITKMVGNIKPNAKQSPLINANNAMKIATRQSSGARTIPLTGAKETRNPTRFLNNSKVIGHGIIAVDLGFRINNIRNAPTMETKIRTTTVESLGFVGSAGLSMLAGKALLPLIFVNPLAGVFLLMIVVGAGAAIAGDYLGKGFGGALRDYSYKQGQRLTY